MTARRIDKALEQFRAGERDLYTEDGQKLYSDEEHERRHEALLERFDREKDSAVAEADRAIEKAERTLALVLQPQLVTEGSPPPSVVAAFCPHLVAPSPHRPT